MKKLVCGLDNVYDKNWNVVYAKNKQDAIRKAQKHCLHIKQDYFSLAICECDEHYRVNFCAMPVTKQ